MNVPGVGLLANHGVGSKGGRVVLVVVPWGTARGHPYPNSQPLLVLNNFKNKIHSHIYCQYSLSFFLFFLISTDVLIFERENDVSTNFIYFLLLCPLLLAGTSRIGPAWFRIGRWKNAGTLFKEWVTYSSPQHYIFFLK